MRRFPWVLCAGILLVGCADTETTRSFEVPRSEDAGGEDSSLEAWDVAENVTEETEGKESADTSSEPSNDAEFEQDTAEQLDVESDVNGGSSDGGMDDSIDEDALESEDIAEPDDAGNGNDAVEWIDDVDTVDASGEEESDGSQGPIDIPCPSDFEFFQETIQKNILTPVCSGCHQAEGPGGTTQFVLVNADAGENWMAINFEMALGVAMLDAPDGSSLLLSKPSGQHPGGHVGGTLLLEGSEEHQWMATFAGRARDEIPCGDEVEEEGCNPLEPGPRVLRRLSRSEFRSTLKDLLYLEAEPEVELAADPVVEGFDNNAHSIVVSPLFAEQVRVAAEQLSAEAVALHFQQLVPCEPSEGISCAEDFVRHFGKRAFRRPLGDGDVGRYLTFFVEAAMDEGFQGGVRWTIAAMLQSSHFLYRSELGKQTDEGVFELSGWELATQLSYLVWGTMPDDLLFAAAESGQLLTEEGLAQELERLLLDARANTTLQQFFGQWLRIETLPVVVRDIETYPELTPEIRADMLGETTRLIDAVLSTGTGTMDDLLTADFTFLNAALASYYGVELEGEGADDEGFQWVSLSGQPYGGLLTQGSVLTTHALPVSSSPIHRGLLVREQLLCEDLPLPPANLDTSPPPMDPNLSTRDRYAMHSEIAACAACHDKIDPIGFGFEHFDGVGRWRETDNGHPVDDTGWIEQTFGEQVAFEGPQELAEELAANPTVEACYTRKWVRFATGLDAEDELSCATSSMEEQMVAAGGMLTGGFGMLTSATHFRFRDGEVGELDAPAAGADVPGPAIPTEDLPDGPGTPDVNAIVEFTDQWEPGYCVKVVVVNTTDEAIEWEVELEFNGTVGTPWNANVELVENQLYRFWGVGWNSTLQAGGSTDFGFCGTL